MITDSGNGFDNLAKKHKHNINNFDQWNNLGKINLNVEKLKQVLNHHLQIPDLFRLIS